MCILINLFRFFDLHALTNLDYFLELCSHIYYLFILHLLLFNFFASSHPSHRKTQLFIHNVLPSYIFFNSFLHFFSSMFSSMLAPPLHFSFPFFSFFFSSLLFSYRLLFLSVTCSFLLTYDSSPLSSFASSQSSYLIQVTSSSSLLSSSLSVFPSLYISSVLFSPFTNLFFYRPRP